MNTCKGYILIVFLLFLCTNAGKTQNISGVINSYSSIDSIISSNKIHVLSTSGFKDNDTVLLIQMKGAECNEGTTDGTQIISNMKGTGRYEFIAIKHINTLTSIVEFKSNLINYTGSQYDFDPKEKLQMVRVPNYRNAKVVNGGVTCKEWNDTTGGVIALIVSDTLILEDSIYANQKGFIGGKYTKNNGICPITKGLMFYPVSASDSAGLKGGGISSVKSINLRGRGRLANAGGGGYGRASGGGGGGNRGKGGYGGLMDELCTDPNGPDGSGGLGARVGTSYFGDITDIANRDRVFMGGGGGAGTGIIPDAGSNGGNGGGIVFIVAKTLITNNKVISSRGQDVNDTSINAGSGGGGGGGFIILSIDKYNGILNLYVTGGKGGSSGNCTGMGGGGGGGFIWLKSTLSGFSVQSQNITGGDPGDGQGACAYAAQSGASGDIAYNFYPVGLMFNYIYYPQTICYNTIPKKITGSEPNIKKTARKIYWESRIQNDTAWTPIDNWKDSVNYQPPALKNTIDIRRIVKGKLEYWTDSIADTSQILTINVVPEILNNQIAGDTSVCYNLPNVMLRGLNATGGDGSYTYNWDVKDTIIWKTQNSNTLNFVASNTNTKYYRRIVKSNICYDTSNVVKVFIYPKIKDDTIKASQTICYNFAPEPLVGVKEVSGGDEKSPYSYFWQKSENNSLFSNTTTISTDKIYAPGLLTKKTYFRRIVFSGMNNTCKDTSNIVLIGITPSINNNSIISGTPKLCENEIADSLICNSNLNGGDGITYHFKWQKSLDRFNWVTIDSIAIKKFKYNQALIDTTYFRSIVTSGACKDTSMYFMVAVHPLISQNYIKTGLDSIICQNQQPSILRQKIDTVHGGDGTYSFSWQKRNITSPWTSVSGVSTSNYQPPVLNETMYYRRIVNSGNVCKDTSLQVRISVLALISGNIITAGQEVCRNSACLEIKENAIIKGGNNSYNYSWQDSISGGTWNTISNATNSSFLPGVLDTLKSFRRIVKSGLNNCCISISNPHIVQINELPVGTLANMDTAICNGNSLNVSFIITGNAPFDLTLKGKLNEVNYSGLTKGVNQLDIKPAYSQKDTLLIDILKDTNGCQALVKPGSVIIRTIKVPQANAGNNADTCGLVYNLKAIPSIGNTKWIDHSGNATFSPSNTIANATVSYNTYGVHKLIWLESNEKCLDSSELIVTFYEQPLKPKIEVNPLELYYTFNIPLKAPVPLVGNGLWTSEDNLIPISNASNPEAIASVAETGEYKFIWTISNGVCKTVSDTLKVIDKHIKSFNGFSPNGDNINDEFVMQGLDNAVRKEITIVNRWGGVVYSNSNYQNNWNGKNNKGEMLPDDTYFYVLKVDNGEIIKGYIVLKR